MKIEKTQRGFVIANFTDANGVECSAQESSAAQEEALLWLGCKAIGLKRFEPYIGWSDVPLQSEPDGISYIANTRMHLTQTQVRELLPILSHFAEHGCLPEEPSAIARPPTGGHDGK